MLRNTPFVLGIDPGISGALVVLNATRNSVISACNIPTLVVKRNTKEKRVLDIHSLVKITRALHHDYPGLTAVLELVGANRINGRQQGGTSMFSFGSTTGAIKTALVAADIPYAEVAPGRWKKALACPADKDAALVRAGELLPDDTGFWTPKRLVRTKEDCKGLAEAAMIGLYGIQFILPNIGVDSLAA